MKFKPLFVSLGLTAIFVGSAQAACEVSLDADVQPILDMNCVACHQDAAPGADLTLQAGSVLAATVSVPSTQAVDYNLIEPGDADASYMFAKLIGTHGEMGGAGDRMPYGGVLDDGDIALIKSWIEDCEAQGE